MNAATVSIGAVGSSTCELLSCSNPVARDVEHPQRGPMDVCWYHARHIDRLRRRWRGVAMNCERCGGTPANAVELKSGGVFELCRSCRKLYLGASL